jgi:hypothetical protein
MKEENSPEGSLNKKSKIILFVTALIFGAMIIGSISYKNSLQRPYEPYHRNEILSWEFKGIVKSIQSPGHNSVTVTINDKQYPLYDYNTSGDLSSDEHEADSTSEFGYNSRIEKGDSLIKEKGQFEIKLVKRSNRKEFVFKCAPYQ